MAGSNKSNSAKAKKRAIQDKDRAAAQLAEKKKRFGRWPATPGSNPSGPPPRN